MTNSKIYIFAAAILLGIAIPVQVRSLGGIKDDLIRDSRSNVFQEIMILKEKNEDLRTEISDLQNTLDQFADQTAALDSIENEILKYKKLSGLSPVFGQGLSITIDGKITTPWIVDLVNEFFNSGAQAVSVNNIRITNQTVGFDTLPQGQILLNGSILSTPYVFNIIGDGSTILDILEIPGGIFDRIKESFSNLSIEKTRKDVIQIN
ncbi:MAG: DUF881 domain-containing protein [Candidatus Peregrinibacteria bacterium]